MRRTLARRPSNAERALAPHLTRAARAGVAAGFGASSFFSSTARPLDAPLRRIAPPPPSAAASQRRQVSPADGEQPREVSTAMTGAHRGGLLQPALLRRLGAHATKKLDEAPELLVDATAPLRLGEELRCLGEGREELRDATAKHLWGDTQRDEPPSAAELGCRAEGALDHRECMLEILAPFLEERVSLSTRGLKSAVASIEGRLGAVEHSISLEQGDARRRQLAGDVATAVVVELRAGSSKEGRGGPCGAPLFDRCGRILDECMFVSCLEKSLLDAIVPFLPTKVEGEPPAADRRRTASVATDAAPS